MTEETYTYTYTADSEDIPCYHLLPQQLGGPFATGWYIENRYIPDKLRQIVLLAKMGRHAKVRQNPPAKPFSGTRTRVRFVVNQDGDLLEFLDG